MLVKRRIKKRETKKNRQQYRLKQINAYNDRLRINGFVSEKHASIQLINYDGKTTLAYVTTQQKWFKDSKAKSYNVDGATKIGLEMGKILKEKFKNHQFYFDRGGKVYTGRIKAMADAIRSQGIQL